MQFVISEDSQFFDTKLRMLKHLRRAANKFVNRCEDQDHISVLGELNLVPIELTINPKLATTYGMAHKLNYGPRGSISSMRLELNKNICSYSPQLIYQIVSHEFAHLVDFLIRGDSFHDDKWSAIHKLMDGEGTTFI